MSDVQGFEFTIDRSSEEPLFTQLARSLGGAITSGRYRAGDRIPTEPELADLYGVSRITVRRAIDELSNDGMVVKRQGKGTYVRNRKVSPKIQHITSFTESTLASGMTPSATVLRREVLDSVPADVPDRAEFRGDRVLYIQRVHFADAAPIMIENNYYPASRYQYLVSEPLEGSLFETLGAHGVVVGGSENSYIDAVAATRAEAVHLAVPVGDPLFLFHREMLDADGGLIYVGRQYIAGSRYRFLYDLT